RVVQADAEADLVKSNGLQFLERFLVGVVTAGVQAGMRVGVEAFGSAEEGVNAVFEQEWFAAGQREGVNLRARGVKLFQFLRRVAQVLAVMVVAFLIRVEAVEAGAVAAERDEEGRAADAGLASFTGGRNAVGDDALAVVAEVRAQTAQM